MDPKSQEKNYSEIIDDLHKVGIACNLDSRTDQVYKSENGDDNDYKGKKRVIV
jgi:hypothetical protein